MGPRGSLAKGVKEVHSPDGQYGFLTSRGSWIKDVKQVLKQAYRF